MRVRERIKSNSSAPFRDSNWFGTYFSTPVYAITPEKKQENKTKKSQTTNRKIDIRKFQIETGLRDHSKI